MSDETPQSPGEGPAAEAGAARGRIHRGIEVPVLSGAAKKASRFSREFVATLLSVLVTALGVVVALAWNTALTTYFAQFLGKNAQVIALFIYAVGITLIAVFVIISMGRVAKRIDAQPVDFKYPTHEKKD